MTVNVTIVTKQTFPVRVEGDAPAGLPNNKILLAVAAAAKTVNGEILSVDVNVPTEDSENKSEN